MELLQLLVYNHVSEIGIVVLGVASAVQAMTFNLSHLMIAAKYRTIASKAPQRLNPIAAAPVKHKSSHFGFWVLFGAIIANTVALGSAISMFQYEVLIKHAEPSKAILVFIFTSFTIVCAI
jgi:hypothetical protein